MARFKQSFNLSKSCSGCKFNSVGVPEMQRLQPASIQETKESEQRGWEQTSLMEKQVSYECLYCIACFVRWCFSFTSSMLTINRVLLRVKRRPRFCLIQHFSFADIGVLGFLMCPVGSATHQPVQDLQKPLSCIYTVCHTASIILCCSEFVIHFKTALWILMHLCFEVHDCLQNGRSFTFLSSFDINSKMFSNHSISRNN